MAEVGRLTRIRRQYACLVPLGGCGAPRWSPCVTRNGTALDNVHAARLDQSLPLRGEPPGRAWSSRISRNWMAA
jgi:hypothetical protein